MNYLADGSGQCLVYINSQLTTISFCTGSETSGPCRPERIDAESAATAAANQSLLTGQVCVAKMAGFPGVDPNTGLSYYYYVDCGDGSTGTGTGGSGTSTNTSSGLQLANQAQQSIFSSIYQSFQTLLSNYNQYAQSTLGFSLANTSSSGTSATSQCFVFTRNLSYGDVGNDVRALTYALKQENLLSDMTSNFDANVMTAVKRFQEAHATEILTVLGLTQGTGVVGEKTRAYLNSKCIVPSYIVANPVTPSPTTPPPTNATTTPNTCATTAFVSNQKTGVYKYTFIKNTDGTYKVQLNNPAYGSVGDKYYVAPNFSFNAPNALDLNRQNQGWFNYLSSLPGTAEGNTFYQNMFGSFNNAYYDWDAMTSQLNAKIAACGTTSPSTTPPPTAPVSTNVIRYIKVSVADWDTLPLALREITILGPNNTIIKPKTVSATDFNVLAYTTPANLSDGNENTVWMANKTTGEDLQVITYDLGQAVAVDRVKIMNYGLTDTRVFVIEVSADGSTYKKIAEVRAQTNTPIADKGIVWGVLSAADLVGPIQY